MNRATTALRRLRRTIRTHRRPLAALCLSLAVVLALRAQAAPAEPSVPVLVAAHDHPGGSPLRAGDLTEVAFRPGSVPAGVLTRAAEVVGRTPVGPVRAGEPLTDVRLLGQGLLEQHPGSVAAPVRIADADSLDLVRAGDRVDVLAADPRGGDDAALVADDATVLLVPPRGRGTALVAGGLVVVAVPEPTARRLAGLGASSVLSVVLVR